MQNFAYSTFGLVPPSRQTKRQVLLHGHENDPPERVIGLGSGEHSFSKMSFLVFPGLGAGGLYLALGAYRRCGRAATTGRGAAAGGVSAATATIAIVTLSWLRSWSRSWSLSLSLSLWLHQPNQDHE